jgi:hypothetical protein
MRLAGAVFLAMAILTGPATPAGGTPQNGCLQGRTVLRTDEMRVFHSARRGDRRFYTCIRDRPPIRSMIWMRRHVQAIAAAGHFFAYAWGFSQQYPATVVVRNARFNRLVFLRYVGVGSDDKNYPSDPNERSLGAEALLVTQRGRVAWIEGDRLPDGRVRHNVYTTRLPRHIRWDRAFDPITDEPDLVDWGTHIDPHSLRLVGTRVTWRNSRRNKSASLL